MNLYAAGGEQERGSLVAPPIPPEEEAPFKLNAHRFERTLSNLPRVFALEGFAAENGYEDAQGATMFLSRLIIALNGVATELSRVSADSATAGAVAAKAADTLWTFGEACGVYSSNLDMTDDARRP